MTIDKIQSESINLADNFAFTGTVTGAGKILNVYQVRTNTAVTIAQADGYTALGLSQAVTPASSSSKFLLRPNVHYSPFGGAEGFVLT